MSVNIDVDGRKSQQNSPFTSSFQAPNLFKHDTPGDMVYGSTGEKGYFYLPAKHAYVWTDAPAARCRIDEIPGDLSGAVCNTDISIGLAISTDPGKEISDGAATVSKAPDVVLAGKAYPALLVTSSDADVTVAIDPETHLVRQFRVDLAKSARERGAQIVNAATFVMDYADTTLNPALKSDEFAWSPPAGSQEIRPQAQVLSEQFAGKPAPAFNLPGLDGKTVSSRELKGSAYILDFWATWCGPCRQELPDLDKIYQDLKSSGLKAFAVDQGEDKDTVTKFVEDTKLTIPALLDADMSVGAAFGASAIPETVLIGKDGKVIKVFTAPFSMDDLRSAAEAAAKGQ
jgi:peroxiredoxin